MSKSTLDRLAVRYFQTALHDANVETTDLGTNVIRALSVFRSGTFKDSWGDPHTWNIEHLEQMVFNFTLLKSRNILPNIPVRDGHGGLFGGGDTVGYVVDLYTMSGYEDGHTRLLADLEITEPDAFGKIERGTWRGRSAEIGFYETNDEVMYWPVFMGVAWVDIPAVEGLFSNHNNSGDKFTSIRDQEQEAPVGTKTENQNNQQGNEGGSEGTPATQQGGEGAPPPSNHNNQQGGNNGGSEGTPPAQQQGGNEGGTPPPPAQQQGTPPAQQHSAPPQGGTHTFQINGKPTTDFGQVQSHISALEKFRDETRDENRKNFVKAIADKGLIAATQVDHMTNHALSLDDEQWKNFKEMYPEDAAPAALFGNHGSNGSESNPSGDEGPSEVDTLRDTVKMHRQSGMSEEKVQQTKSYKRLQALTQGAD